MRILLVRTSALGDVVHALPVLVAIAAAMPQARVGWAIDAVFEPLLAGHPLLDRVLPLSLRDARRRPRRAGSLHRFARELGALRSFGADVAIDLMGNWKGATLAAVSGAPRRIGFASRARAESASAALANERVAPRAVHAVDRGLELLAPLGIRVATGDFRGDLLAPSGDDDARALLRATPRPVLIQPGAGWVNKQYPPQRWGRLAGELASAGLPVAVLSARGEESLAQAVVAASGDRASHWSAPTLPMLVTLLRGARLVLGGDTGPLHLAHALGTPVLAVQGPTGAAGHGPYRSPTASVALDLPCSGCHQRLPTIQGCLQGLPVEWLAARALTTLGLA